MLETSETNFHHKYKHITQRISDHMLKMHIVKIFLSLTFFPLSTSIISALDYKLTED